MKNKRLEILHNLDRGKITVEQANKELSILNGGSNWFSHFTKWELFNANLTMTESLYQSPIMGGDLICHTPILMDVFVRYNLKTGFPQYKEIRKLCK